MAGFRPQTTIAGKDAEAIRSPLSLTIGYTGNRSHGSDATAGLFQLHNVFAQICPCLSCNCSR